MLRECLRGGDVERALAVGRTPTGVRHDRLEELVHRNFSDLSGVESRLAGYDACFFCLGVSSAAMFRPAFIQPSHGERSRTRLYRIGYAVIGWMFPLLRRLFPRYVTTTEEVGRAMLRVAREGRRRGSSRTSPSRASARGRRS